METSMENQPKRGIGQAIRKGFVVFALAMRKVEGRTLTGLFLLVMGVTIAMYPSFSAAGQLAGIGISPKLLAIMMAVSGGLILRWPDTRYYILLTFPFVLYVWGNINWVNNLGALGSLTPVVTTVFLFLFMVIAEARDGRHR
jgi:hypothetical protein